MQEEAFLNTAVQVGDTVQTKKKHPCGSDLWLVTRVGADYKIKCKGCGWVVMLPFEEFVRKVKRVYQNGEQ